MEGRIVLTAAILLKQIEHQAEFCEVFSKRSLFDVSVQQKYYLISMNTLFLIRLTHLLSFYFLFYF